MHLISVKIDDAAHAVRPFALMRDRVLPSVERRRKEIEAMYSPAMGRPETDPVILLGVTVLQIMMRLPDRACVEAFTYDARWRAALGDVPGFHPTTLVHFRNRLASNGKARLALDASLESMREAGYLKSCGAVRIDSTHLLGRIADMSRLECVRETLRLALEFLAEFGGPESWEPWHGRYAERNPEELRNASAGHLASCMASAGADMRGVLHRAAPLGETVCAAAPVALLRRVFGEQFEESGGRVSEKRAADAGAVINPHDPEAQWSTKGTLGKGGWHGYKAQVCETVEDGRCVKGEPTRSVITAVHVQPAINSDHGSVPGILAEHRSAVGAGGGVRRRGLCQRARADPGGGRRLCAHRADARPAAQQGPLQLGLVRRRPPGPCGGLPRRQRQLGMRPDQRREVRAIRAAVLLRLARQNLFRLSAAGAMPVKEEQTGIQNA